MGSAKIILRNTLFTYGRTILSACLTLFSSRWVLADLGASDFGIFGLVGGTLQIVGMISAVMGQGVNRFLAYSLGKNDKADFLSWFNVSLNLFFLLSLVLIPVGLGIGELLVRFVLKIDPSRLNAALWVLRFTVVSFAVSLFSTPYLGVLIARQYIHLSASVVLIHSLGAFAIACLLRFFSGDHLILYSGLMALSLSLMNAAYVAVVKAVAPEVRLAGAYWWNAGRMKELVKYCGWILVGTLGTIIRSQGLSIIVNWMRGTVANAGYAVANSLSGQMQTLSNAFLMAISPEAVRREGAGAHGQMMHIAQRSVKLGMTLLLLVGLPLFCECGYVLKLWLKAPPPYAAFFTRIVIVVSFLYKLAVGQQMCFQATGKIRAQMLVELLSFSLAVPLVGGAYFLTRSVHWAMSMWIVSQALYAAGMFYVGERVFGWRAAGFVRGVALPFAAVFFLGWCAHRAAIAPRFHESFARLAFSSLLLGGYSLAAAYWFAFTREERAYVGKTVSAFVSGAVQKIPRRRPGRGRDGAV